MTNTFLLAILTLFLGGTASSQANWVRMDSGTANSLMGICGLSPDDVPTNDVFVVGFDGVVLHYDGQAWARMPDETNGSLNFGGTVWSSSAGNVFIVGQGGTILRRAGK